MKIKNTLFFYMVSSLLMMSPFSQGGTGEPWPVKHYKEIVYPKQKAVKKPDLNKVTLDNGLQIYLLEDHQIPLVKFYGLIRIDPTYEPDNKTGLCTMAIGSMRSGGTMTRSSNQISDLLDAISASVTAGTAIDSAFISASCLREDIDTIVDVLMDILRSPAFPADKVRLVKRKRTEAIIRRKTNPSTFGIRTFNKLIYGANSIYTRQPRLGTIRNIRRGDIESFHKRFFGPNNVMLAVCGDFNTDKLIQKISRAVQGWDPVTVERVKIPDVREQPYAICQINKQDAKQSHILMGHLGIQKNNKDYFALIVMNKVLSGRLYKNIRNRQGLAYAIGSQYPTNYDYPGIFCVSCQTQSSNTVKVIQLILEEIRGMMTSLVTDEELTVAKDSYLNSFVFQFNGQMRIVRRLMTYDFYGYPDDFLEKTRDNIYNVTKEDILRVAQNYLNPDKMKTLVIGCTEDFDQPLSILGEVKEIGN